MREFGISKEPDAKHLISSLEQAGLLPTNASLGQYFRGARRLIWSYLFPERDSVEHTIAIDPSSGLPIVTRKTNFRASPAPENAVDLPLDDLITKADLALKQAGYTLWILFDRLDVAFNDNPELEQGNRV